VVPAAGLALELIPPVPMPRRPSRTWCWSARGCSAVIAHGHGLRRLQAEAVLGFGGYVSTPAYLAARRLGMPDRHPRAERAARDWPTSSRPGSPRTSYTSFPQTPLPHASCIGLPLRRGIADLDRAARRDQAREAFGLEPGLPTCAGQRRIPGGA
jgi:UDP-N-acetylglucosamine--N-acetylmuramyl-(pentapeptide) pyrophosphoryl-undecaprenol N-acetylglucosamine transferase